MNRSRFLVAVMGLAGAVVLCINGSAVSARLSISSSTFRQTYRSLEFEHALGTVRCPVTLEGSFASRTINKVAASTIGSITRAAFNEASCAGGRAGALPEGLPWSMTYSGFTGTLPNITRTIRGAFGRRIYLAVNGTNCVYRAYAIGVTNDSSWAITLAQTGSIVTGVNFSGDVELDPPGQAGCPRVARSSSDTGRETLSGSTTAISLTLI